MQIAMASQCKFRTRRFEHGRQTPSMLRHVNFPRLHSVFFYLRLDYSSTRQSVVEGCVGRLCPGTACVQCRPVPRCCTIWRSAESGWTTPDCTDVARRTSTTSRWSWLPWTVSLDRRWFIFANRPLMIPRRIVKAEFDQYLKTVELFTAKSLISISLSSLDCFNDKFSFGLIFEVKNTYM